MRVGQGRALRGGEKGAETCVFVCLYYKVATPRQLLNEQHVLGLTRDIFTVSPSPSSTSPAAAAPCACSAASAGVSAGSHCGSFFFLL